MTVPRTADDFLDLLRKLLAELAPEVDTRSLTLATEVASLGIASIQLLELVSDIEDALGVLLPDDELTTLRTVRDLLDVVTASATVD